MGAAVRLAQGPSNAIGESLHLLDATSLGLEPHDIAALYDTADADNDGTVDYAEFMKVAFAVLVGLAREKALRQIEEEGEEEDDSDEEEGDGGASD